jgi:hypothetical protein
MLAITQVANTTSNVFVAPTSKTSFVYVDVASNNGSQVNITISIGNGSTFYTYWTGTTNFVSAKLILTAGDIVQVGTTGTVNVFVHGQEM